MLPFLVLLLANIHTNIKMADYKVSAYSFATGEVRVLRSNIELVYNMAFLKCPPGLDSKTIAELQYAAMEMYCLGDESCELKVDSCEGRLFNTGKTVVLGSLVGRVVEGRVETNAWDKPQDVRMIIKDCLEYMQVDKGMLN